MENSLEKIKIMLVDDHALVRDGIRSLLEDEDNIEVIKEASTGLEAIEILNHCDPDLMIIDIRMPKMTGIELVSQISKTDRSTKYLMLSMHDSEEYVLQSIDAGAHGYLLKDASRDEFLKAIHTVHQDGVYYSGDISKYLLRNIRNTPTAAPLKEEKLPLLDNPNPASLTKREIQILELATSGKSNIEIAELLGKSKRTVEVHRFNMMKKIGSKNLADLIIKSRELGYI